MDWPVLQEKEIIEKAESPEALEERTRAVERIKAAYANRADRIGLSQPDE